MLIATAKEKAQVLGVLVFSWGCEELRAAFAHNGRSGGHSQEGRWASLHWSSGV